MNKLNIHTLSNLSRLIFISFFFSFAGKLYAIKNVWIKCIYGLHLISLGNYMFILILNEYQKVKWFDCNQQSSLRIHTCEFACRNRNNLHGSKTV